MFYGSTSIVAYLFCRIIVHPLICWYKETRCSHIPWVIYLIATTSCKQGNKSTIISVLCYIKLWHHHFLYEFVTWTADFITVVTTVIQTITFPWCGDAFIKVAGEFISSTSYFKYTYTNGLYGNIYRKYHSCWYCATTNYIHNTLSHF